MEFYMDAGVGRGVKANKNRGEKMPATDLIEAKMDAIQLMIQDLQQNERILHRIGGATIQNRGEELAFQRERLDYLEWALKATDDDIQKEIAKLENSLTEEEKSCKYGEVCGLPMETIKTISFIELLEIALGTHPYV